MKKLLFVQGMLSVFFISTQTQANQYFSQSGQDKFVYENFFHNRENGVFVDIGAADGEFNSNTLFFERKGWKGVCVEPVEHTYNQLVKVRKCACIHGCTWHKTGPAKFIKVAFPDGTNQGWSGLVDSYDPRQLKIVLDMWVKERNCTMEIIDVQCYRFDDICKQNNISHIDYLSIDTEGSEFDILRSINFEEIDIDIIDVENNYNEPYIREFIKSKGYIFIGRVGVDDIYRNKKYHQQ